MGNITDIEKDLILSLARSRGYLGFRQNAYYLQSDRGHKSRTYNTLCRDILFPQSLNQDGLYRIFANYKDLKADICKLLESISYEGATSNYSNPLTSMEVATEDTSKEISEAIQQSLQVFKTPKFNSLIDPFAKKNGGGTLLIINTDTRQILNGNSLSYDMVLQLKGTSRPEIMADPNIPLVWPQFNPYTPNLTFTKYLEELNAEITILNTAIPPKWMTLEDPRISPGIPPFIRTLIDHLFPYEEEREAVLDWCHYAIFKRNGTILCLAGDRGTGKSTFVEILSHLVGTQYSEIVSEAILTDKFNSQFRDKRLLIFEEVALAENKHINKIKGWCNRNISIEEKGANAYSALNYASMVFLVNDLADLKIQAQERRFSIPIVAEENLLTVIPEEEVANFKLAMEEETPEFISGLAEFGLFLKNRIPKNSEYLPIKGENYMRVTDLSLKGWQGHIKEYIIDHGEAGVLIPISDIVPPKNDKERGLIFPNRRDHVENFLRDYRHLGKYKIADIKEISREEMEAIELAKSKFGLARRNRPHLSEKDKTKRLYGLIPRKEFMDSVRKEKEPTDLL